MSLGNLLARLKASYGSHSERVRGRVAAARAVMAALPRCMAEPLERRMLLASVSVSGTVFDDLNADGVLDPGEWGFVGFRILLCPLGSEQPVATATTDAAGQYRLSRMQLPGGTYILSEETPSQSHSIFIQTAPAEGSYTLRLRGEDTYSASGLDFGNMPTGEIAGAVYDDLNGNGTRDFFESGLPEWTVRWTKPDGTVVASTLTAADGSYSFSGVVAPGTYEISEVHQGGWAQTEPQWTPNNLWSYKVVMVPDQNWGNMSFGNTAGASISGVCFNDSNLNGIRERDEAALAGWTIELERIVGGGAFTYATTTTGPDGRYAFTDLPPGGYYVVEHLQPGWAYTVGSGQRNFNLSPGDNVTGNFGDALVGEIHGVAFNDPDDDGIRQEDEPGVPGRTIELRRTSDGPLIASTITGADGSYAFLGVAPGPNVVSEPPQNGWIAPATAPWTRAVHLPAGGTVNGIDFANVPGSLIGFDDLAVNTVLGDQYDDQNIVFIVYPAERRTQTVIKSLPLGYPHSDGQVADISVLAPNVENANPWVGASLAKTASKVSVYVGLMQVKPGSRPVVLTAYDANNNVVGSDGPWNPGDFFDTPLQVTSATANIASFTIESTSYAGDHVGIDDLRFVTPPSDPDFSLVPASDSVLVGPGGSNTATINVVRFNGSFGSILFSASGLPDGVTASFSPHPADYSSTELTLTAAPEAPDTPYIGQTITITGTPGNAFAGSAPRNTTLNVVVRHEFVAAMAPNPIIMALHGEALVTITRALEFTGNVQLQVPGLPPGMSVSFNPNPVTLADYNHGNKATSVMTLTADPGAPLQPFTGQVIATCGGEASTVMFTVIRIAGRVDSVSPIWGSTPQALQPGTLITLKGDGFLPGSKVQFGASNDLAPASYVSPDHTELQVRVPRLATDGVLTVSTILGSFSSTDSVGIVSYRNTYGYSFVNPTAEGVGWDTAEKLYGYEAMHWLFIPSPLAAIYVKIVDELLKDGQCYGVCRTTQQFMHGAQSVMYYPPYSGGSTIWGLTGPDAASDPLWWYIHVQHTAQTSAEAINHFIKEALDHWACDGMAQVKNEIASALQGGDHPLVSMHNGTQGHTVVAYDLEDDPNDPGGYYIRVYDCNRPFTVDENKKGNAATHDAKEQDSRIHVTGGKWYFNLGGSDNWDGHMQTLEVIPYNVVPFQPTMPASLSGVWELITGESASTTQISDASGHFLLNPDGKMNEDPATRMPNALEYGVGVNPNASPLFLLDSGGQYTQTITGTKTGTYNTQLLGDGIGVNLQNVPSVPNVNDQLRMDLPPLRPATGAARFEFRTAAPSKIFSVDLVAVDPIPLPAPQTEGSAPAAAGAAATARTVSIQSTSFQNAGDTFGFDSNRQKLIYTHEGPPTQVTLTFTQPDDNGNVQTFAAQPVILGTGDTAVLTPSNWSHLNEATLTLVLTHSDGSKVTQLLPRQSLLPVLTLSTQLAKLQDADLIIYPGPDDSGAPVVRPLSSITAINIADGASAVLDKPGGGLIDLPALTLGPSSRLTIPSGVDKLLRLTAISLGSNATLDLADNDMIVQNGDPVAIRAWIKSARLIGKGDKHTTLAAFLNDKGDTKTRIKEEFGGQDVGLSDVLVKYSWDGDANLDGVVNADDYFQIDSGFISQKPGWYNGDFNYDGVVNADDYFLIDWAFVGQTGPLAGRESPAATTHAAPEPADSAAMEDVVIVKPAKKQEADSLLAELFSTEPVL